MGNNIKAPRPEELLNSGAGEAARPADYLTLQNRETVKGKLATRFPNKGQNELAHEAEILSQWEKVRDEYFAHLLDTNVAQAVEDTFDQSHHFHPRGYRNPHEKRRSERRLKKGVDRIHGLQVHLLWYELKDDFMKQKISHMVCRFLRSSESKFEYGPFHVALQIGDVVIDWDETSLVIPRRVKKVMPVMRANVHDHEARATPHVVEMPFQTNTAAEGFNFFANQLLDTAEEKGHLIEQICKVIATYNAKHDYGIFSNNCQHFAQDMLVALGRDKDAELFRGRAQCLANLVMKAGRIQIEFNNHVELDGYVRSEIDRLTPEDLEYLHLHYLLFHTWSRRFPEREAWRCNPQTCRISTVEERLT